MSLAHTAAQMMGASAGPELLSVSHVAVVESTCPTSPNFSVNYTARNFGEGDEVRVSAIKDGGTPEVIGTFPVVKNGALLFTWGVRNTGTTVNVDIQARVEIRRSGSTLSSEDSTASTHTIEEGDSGCPGADFT